MGDYLLQTTLFVAILTLDMRMKLRRGARELNEEKQMRCCKPCVTSALSDPKINGDRPTSFFGGRYASVLLSKAWRPSTYWGRPCSWGVRRPSWASASRASA